MLRKQFACVAFVTLVTCAFFVVASVPLRAQQTPANGNAARPRRAAPSTPAPSSSPAQAAGVEQGRTKDSSPTSPAKIVSPENADLSITAHVTARELRFEKVPNPTVEFTGQPRRETVWEAERENLPDQVQPGVTYRNVGITLRITSVFADIDRIVAEALGETAASDDANEQKPSSSPTPQASAPVATIPLSNSTNTTRAGATRKGRKN